LPRRNNITQNIEGFKVSGGSRREEARTTQSEDKQNQEDVVCQVIAILVAVRLFCNHFFVTNDSPIVGNQMQALQARGRGPADPLIPGRPFLGPSPGTLIGASDGIVNSQHYLNAALISWCSVILTEI
jgi:hypothetical protein